MKTSLSVLVALFLLTTFARANVDSDVKIDSDAEPRAEPGKVITADGQKSAPRKPPRLNRGGLEPISEHHVASVEKTPWQIPTGCGGIECIDRKFRQIAGAGGKIAETTPAAIAENLVRGENNFVAVLGEKGSGKSTLLSQTLHKLSTGKITTESVGVNLENIGLLAYWGPEDMLLANFDENRQINFKKMLQHNSKKVIFVVDNIDKVSPDRGAAVIKYLTEQNKRGVGVVVSSTKKLDHLPLDTAHTINVEIPEITAHEIATFLSRHWDKIAPNHQQKHVDYAKAVAKVLHEAPLPRNFEPMKVFSQVLYTGDRDVVGATDNFISVRNYDRKKGSSVGKVLDSLATMKLNKFALFKKLTALRLDLTYTVKYLGVHAFKNTLSRHLPATDPFLSKISKASASELEYPIDKAASEFIRVSKDNNIEFIHPEYEPFFAAEYIKEQVKLHPMTRNRITETVLSDSAYFQVAEYLDSALGDPRVRDDFKSALKKISRGSKRFSKVMDNALSFGFDNIAAAVVEEATKSQIKKYFVKKNEASSKIAFKGKYQFGMLSSAEKTGTFERSQMLFKKNMEKTIEKLIEADSKLRLKESVGLKIHKPNEIWLTEEWFNYLKEFYLTQPKPSIKIYNMMKPYMGMELSENELSELMLKAINHGGLRNKRIIHDLLVRGATPAIITEQGETLVHIALKHRDLDLLKYVVEQLHVPFEDRSGIKSILSTILDTNPFPRYSPPQFWETLQYTLQNGKIDVPHSSLFDRLDQKLFNPSLEDTISLTYSILTETDRQTVAESILQLELSHGVENVSPGLKNYRKNFVLSIVQPDSPDSLTLTEIVLKYRGLGVLTPYERAAYESCIYSALSHDTSNKAPTKAQQERIIDAVLENIGTVADFTLAKRFVNSPKLQEKFNTNRIKNLQSTLKNYKTWKSNKKLTGSELREDPLKAGVSLTRAQLSSELESTRYPTNPPSVDRILLPNGNLFNQENGDYRQSSALDTPRFQQKSVALEQDFFVSKTHDSPTNLIDPLIGGKKSSSSYPLKLSMPEIKRTISMPKLNVIKTFFRGG